MNPFTANKRFTDYKGTFSDVSDGFLVIMKEALFEINTSHSEFE